MTYCVKRGGLPTVLAIFFHSQASHDGTFGEISTGREGRISTHSEANPC